MLRLEKPPVLHSSDSTTCDSLCVLWAEPHSYMLFPLLKVVHNYGRTSAESLQKRVNLLLRITECSGLEGTSVSHLVQPSCRNKVTYSRQQTTLSRQVLNISREGDSTTSLGSLFQCSVTLRGKKFFLMFRRNFCASVWELLRAHPFNSVEQGQGALWLGADLLQLSHLGCNCQLSWKPCPHFRMTVFC